MKVHYVVARIDESDNGTMEVEITHESLEPRHLAVVAGAFLKKLPEDVRELLVKPTTTPITNRE